jgi:hypothetical protein
MWAGMEDSCTAEARRLDESLRESKMPFFSFEAQKRFHLLQQSLERDSQFSHETSAARRTQKLPESVTRPPVAREASIASFLSAADFARLESPARQPWEAKRCVGGKQKQI